MEREISGYYYDGKNSYIVYKDERGNETMEERFEPEINQILNNHADWFDDNISKVEGNRCRKQAIAYAHKDKRQKGVRKHDRSNPVGDRFGADQE